MAGEAPEPEQVRSSGADADPVAQDGAAIHPAGFCHGAGLLVVYANQAFRNLFGEGCVGLPAREGMLGLSGDGFAVMDAVLKRGRPAARWVKLNGARCRLTVAPRADPANGEVYGIAFHLRPEDDSGAAS